MQAIGVFDPSLFKISGCGVAKGWSGERFWGDSSWAPAIVVILKIQSRVCARLGVAARCRAPFCTSPDCAELRGIASTQAH
jgi:hypothetical protein